MQNVIVTIFKEEGSTYQALSELKNSQGSSTALVAGIIKNSNGHIVIKEGYNLEKTNDPNWVTGALVGGLIGILGGPVGMLIGGSYGMVVGSIVDTGEAVTNVSLISKVVSELDNYNLALVCVVDETDEDVLNDFFNKYNASNIIRESVLSVQASIYQAQELEKQLRKDAKKELREERKEEWHEKAKSVEDNIKEKFDNIKNKIKK